MCVWRIFSLSLSRSSGILLTGVGTAFESPSLSSRSAGRTFRVLQASSSSLSPHSLSHSLPTSFRLSFVSSHPLSLFLLARFSSRIEVVDIVLRPVSKLRENAGLVGPTGPTVSLPIPRHFSSFLPSFLSSFFFPSEHGTSLQ